ncbi:conserved hypothetical protein [Tenacibaculum sp. 190524A02b]|uniref:Uncharacterized protein n=1 Tax=Tenacibaculum vairaonense TaxID=3137860 RepID=A0ABM9PR09_9FLAO
MTKETILKRIEYLRNAIAYSRNELKYMSIEQGICCNQEIAALFKIMHNLELNESSIKEPTYIIPEHLEQRVEIINYEIEQTNWQKPKIL